MLKDLDFSAWAALAPEVAGILKDTAQQSGQQAIDYFGFKSSITDLMNENAADWAEKRAAELVGMKYNADGELVENPRAEWAITDGTREQLRADVNNAIQEGLSTSDLSDILQDNYAFSDERADMIGRTEIATAHVEGQMISYRDAGVEEKEWLLSDEPCEICEGNADDGVIGIDENFSSGDDAAPAHPNCECDILPIIAGLSDDDSNENDEE